MAFLRVCPTQAAPQALISRPCFGSPPCRLKEGTDLRLWTDSTRKHISGSLPKPVPVSTHWGKYMMVYDGVAYISNYLPSNKDVIGFVALPRRAGKTGRCPPSLQTPSLCSRTRPDLTQRKEVCGEKRGGWGMGGNWPCAMPTFIWGWGDEEVQGQQQINTSPASLIVAYIRNSIRPIPPCQGAVTGKYLSLVPLSITMVTIVLLGSDP